MTRTVLRLSSPPPLRVDLRGITPQALAALAPAAIERLPVVCGRWMEPLGEWFSVSRRTDGAPNAEEELRFEGDLSRFDRIGWGMAAGRIVVEGGVGDYAGACLQGGELRIEGSAGALAACEMAGGRIDIGGAVGDFAASTLPGSMDGMRGGLLLVRGGAGARFGDRMRRGTALVCGDTGDFPASRMVAGTIAIGGRAGAHAGYGMRRGSVVFAGPAPTPDPCFVPLIGQADVFWQLLARDLARHGGPFEGLPSRAIARHAGDLSAAGHGELIIPR